MSDTLDPNFIDPTQPVTLDAETFEREDEANSQGSWFLKKKDEDELFDYIDLELNAIINNNERRRFLNRVARYRKRRIALPDEETKNWPWENACFHPDVEILTSSGWKFVKDVSIGEKVLSRRNDGLLAYQPVEATEEYPFSGNLVHMQNLFFDIQVTPNHEFHLERRSSGKEVVYTAQELLEEAKGIYNTMLPLTGSWEAEPAESFFDYDAEDFLRFLGWYLSEGWVFKNRCVGIAQSRSANPENCDEIERVLDSMGVEYSYRNNSQYLVNVEKVIVDYLRVLGKSYEKYIPREVLDLPKEQLELLFDALISGDGCVSWHTDKPRNFPSVTYATTSRRLADDMMELAQKIGISARVAEIDPKPGGKIRGRRITGKRTQYSVSFRFTKRTRLRHDRAKFEYVAYDGPVYDVTVSPWHTIYVRQNGKPLWSGNSNVVPPIALMETNGMFSMLKSSFKARNPFYEVRSLRDSDEKMAKGISSALSMLVEAKNYINMRKKNNKMLYELGSLGTQFAKVRWNVETRSWKEALGDGTFNEIAVSVKSFPDVEPVMIEDIFTRVYWDDVQRCAYIAQRIPYTEAELKALEASGVYQNVQDVFDRGGDKIDENRADLLEKLGLDPESEIDSKTFFVFEVALSWDVDGDGVMEEIIAWYDPVSKARLRLDMNNLGHRPIYKVDLLEIPWSIYGLGVGGLVDNIQEEIIDLHNMRNDSTMLSMLQVAFVKNGVPFGTKEALRPGKVVRLPDPQKDVFITKYPDVGNVTLAGEAQLQQYSHQASAVPEDTLGFANSVIRTRETYGGQMLRAQSASRVYAAMEESVKEGYSEIGMGLFLQLLAHPEEAKVLAELLPDDEKAGFLESLEIPIDEVSERFVFSIQTMEIEKTEEAKRQSYLTLTQLYSLYAEKLLSLLQIVYAQNQEGQAQIPQPIREAALEIVVGSTKLIAKIMKSFGEEDYDDYLPYYRNIELMIEALDMQKEMQSKQLEAQLSQVKEAQKNQGAGQMTQAPQAQGGMNVLQ